MRVWGIVCAGALALCGAPAIAQGLQIGTVVASDGACPSAQATNPGTTRPVYSTNKGALCVNTSAGSSTITGPLGRQTDAASVSNALSTEDVALLNSIITNTAAATPAGTNLIGKTGIDQTTPGTTNGVTIAPTATAGAGIAPVVSASAESNHVFKGSAGNLYSAYVTTGATAGYFLLFDATSAPGDGAVTPIHCIPVSSNSTVGVNFTGPPEVYATGITAVFSSTGCFTKTASATAFFHGSTK